MMTTNYLPGTASLIEEIDSEFMGLLCDMYIQVKALVKKLCIFDNDCGP